MIPVWSTVVNTPSQGRLIGTVLDKQWNGRCNGSNLCNIPNDRIAWRTDDHYAQHCLLYRVIWEVTLVLSNLSYLSSRESGRTMRRGPYPLSHPREKGGLYAPHVPNYPKNWAQGFIARHCSGRSTTVYTSPCTRIWWVYPGCVGGVYTGWVYQGVHRVHIAQYTSLPCS